VRPHPRHPQSKKNAVIPNELRDLPDWMKASTPSTE
jgi:hypothetical protein